jgi:hypothetical protein
MSKWQYIMVFSALAAGIAMMAYITYGPRPELSPIGKRIHVEHHDESGRYGKSCKAAYDKCIQDKADALPSFAEE